MTGLAESVPNSLRDLQKVTLGAKHALEMARMLFDTFIAVSIIGILIITPFIAANKLGAAIVFSCIGIAAWGVKRMAIRGHSVRAMHIFGVVIGIVATVPLLFLGRHIGMAAIAIFAFIPAYAAITGLVSAVIYVGGFVVVATVFTHAINAGYALPVIFPLPLPVQVAIVAVCTLAVLLPLPALFRSMAEERHRSETELQKRIAREKELEIANAEIRAANQAKSDFLANMSHEIRTPMNAIIGLTQLLLESNLTSQQSESIKTVHSSSNALLRLINDILDLSRIETGRLQIFAEPFNLIDLLEEIRLLFSVSLTAKNLPLDISVAPDVPNQLLSDELRLRQIIINLLGNAIKFTDHGRIEIKINTVERSADYLKIRIEVTDTGIGIATAQIPKLFAPFSQADASMSRRYGGSGLGLSISRSLIELMGGEITVHSQPGTGTSFVFTIVVQAGEPAPATPRVEIGINEPERHGETTHWQLPKSEFGALAHRLAELDELLKTNMLEAQEVSAQIQKMLGISAASMAFRPIETATNGLQFREARHALSDFMLAATRSTTT